MLTTHDIILITIMAVFHFVILGFLFFLAHKKERKQLDNIFLIILFLVLIWLVISLSSILFKNYISSLFFVKLGFVPICFLPTALLFMSLIFKNTRISFKAKYLLLAIFPILSLTIIWTNDFHHLFFAEYSSVFADIKFGPYAYVYYSYTVLMCVTALNILVKYVITNSGFFSKTAALLIIGISMPILTYILGFLGILTLSFYITPMAFAFGISFMILSTMRFNLFKNPPVSLQRVVDRMSDCYMVLNGDYIVTDFNNTFLETFNTSGDRIRNRSLIDLAISFNDPGLSVESLKSSLERAKNSTETIFLDKHIKQLHKHFHIEITSIYARDEFIGLLFLLKDYSQHVHDMQALKDSQEMLMEKERLASLGQLIGGIAHNLNTPIMSIAGATEGLNDLIKEFDSSIDDPEVKEEDYHEIAKDMYSWINKIKNYIEYMSDVISTVKGQAVAMSEQDTYKFTIDELVKRVHILMKHELQNALVTLDVNVSIDENTEITGNINSLVQVINNMIYNSIQAYDAKGNQHIELNISKEFSNIIITVKDYAGGIPDEVLNKLFKEMVTTKGKNGTGLGLYMSYSNIRAHFNGNIVANSKPGLGTEFKIILPV